MPYVDAIEVYAPLYKNQSLEEVVEYRIVSKEQWEKLKEGKFGEKPCYVVDEESPDVMKIYPGQHHPQACIRYDEVMTIATKILDMLPFGKVVIDNEIYQREKVSAVDLVLDIVLTALGKK